MAKTRIQSLRALHLKIRLKKPIRHASHSRTENDTLIVRCELTDGSVGWGEGLPRPYVTGETIDSTFEQLKTSSFEILGDCDFSNPLAVIAATSHLQLRIVEPPGCDSNKSGYGNSVRCAVELACLDASARAAGVSVSHVIQEQAKPLGLKHVSSSVRYSGVVTSSASRLAQFRSALKMRLFGFDAVKLKVGHPEICDRQLAARVRRIIGRRVDLRVDANEAWTPDEAVSKIRQLIPFGISCVEQPLSDAHRSAFPEIRSQIDVPMMLDESLCSIADANAAVAQETCDAFNVRISKCGGIGNCLQIMKIAKDSGLFLQLGCLVGETGILSAAGRHLASSVGPIRFYEGSYDRFVVRDRLTTSDVTFGYGGIAPAISGPGLGITVNEAEVTRLTQRTLKCM